MPDPGLTQLEREVEDARAKLATDLSRLRSPETAAEFTEGLKQEAIDAKDALLVKTKATIKSSIDSLLDDLKARAATNPAAILAIGSGLAWQLIRRPPIATALVGVGLVSLFRTTPAPFPELSSTGYLSQAKNRLLDQAIEVADMAKEKAGTIGDTVSQQVAQTAAGVRERVSDLTAQTTSAVREAVDDAKERSSSMWSKTTQELKQAGEAGFSVVASRASGVGDQVQAAIQDPLAGTEDRDNLLLGAAGLAVIAALGLACQRRLAEREDEEANRNFGAWA